MAGQTLGLMILEIVVVNVSMDSMEEIALLSCLVQTNVQIMASKLDRLQTTTARANVLAGLRAKRAVLLPHVHSSVRMAAR